MQGHPHWRKGLPQGQPLLSAFRALFWQVALANAWIGSLWSLELASVPWLGGSATEEVAEAGCPVLTPNTHSPMTLGLSTKGHLNPCCHRGMLVLLPGCPHSSQPDRRGGKI